MLGGNRRAYVLANAALLPFQCGRCCRWRCQRYGHFKRANVLPPSRIPCRILASWRRSWRACLRTLYRTIAILANTQFCAVFMYRHARRSILVATLPSSRLGCTSYRLHMPRLVRPLLVFVTAGHSHEQRPARVRTWTWHGLPYRAFARRSSLPFSFSRS